MKEYVSGCFFLNTVYISFSIRPHSPSTNRRSSSWDFSYCRLVAFADNTDSNEGYWTQWSAVERFL